MPSSLVLKGVSYVGIEVVMFTQALGSRHEDADYLNLIHTNAFLRDVLRIPSAFFPLFYDYRRRLLLLVLGHGQPLQFRGPVDPAMSVVGAGAPGC